MTRLGIILDGSVDNVVYAGQVVTGQVHVETTETIRIRGIRLELRGQGFVHWRESQTEHGTIRYTADGSRSFSGSEEYTNLEIYLTGSRNNSGELYLQPGSHDFPFTFVVPPGAPNSFESDAGHVRYTAKAVIDRLMRMDDTVEIKLKVVHLLDLNMESQHLWEPLSTFNHSPVVGVCCCCIRGAVDMSIRLNRGCFTPGETILIDGELYNRSNSRVKNTAISLVQKVRYFSSWNGRLGHSAERLNIVATVERPGFDARETDSFENVELQVPRVAPSRLDGCRIIDIAYCIEVRTNFVSYFSYSFVNCKIVIGNVPLKGFSQPPVLTLQPMPYTPLEPPPPYSVNPPEDPVKYSTEAS